MKYNTLTVMLVGAATLALGACSSDDDNNQPANPTNAIEFNVTVPGSRAVTSTTSISAFKVWAFVPSNSNPLFMNGVEVTRPLTGGNWSYSPVMYWPVDKAVNFYSISPAIKTTTSPNQGTEDIPGYVNDGTTDLLYAVTMNQVRDETQNAQAVKLNFRHAMSRILFNLQRLERPESPIQVEVDKVEIININSVGTFVYPRETTAPLNESKVVGNWAENTITTPRSYTIYDGESVELTDNYKPIPKEEVTEGRVEFAIPQTLTPSTVSADGQTYGGAYVRVFCSIYDENTGVKLWPGKEVPGYDEQSGNAYIYFPLCGENAVYKKWEIGKAYAYNLTVDIPSSTSTTIEFDVTVDEYPEFTGTDL